MVLQVEVKALAARGRPEEAVEIGRHGLDLLGDRRAFARGLLLRSVSEVLRHLGRFDEAYAALDQSAELERASFRELSARQLELQRASLEARSSRRSLTLSVGVASTNEPVEPGELLATADRRLYEAKSRGRNCVVGPAAA